MTAIKQKTYDGQQPLNSKPETHFQVLFSALLWSFPPSTLHVGKRSVTKTLTRRLLWFCTGEDLRGTELRFHLKCLTNCLPEGCVGVKEVVFHFPEVRGLNCILPLISVFFFFSCLFSFLSFFVCCSCFLCLPFVFSVSFISSFCETPKMD